MSRFSPSVVVHDRVTAKLNDVTGLLGSFRALLPAGSPLLVSGLLAGDEGAIVSALQARGFSVAEIVRENEWLAICAR